MFVFQNFEYGAFLLDKLFFNINKYFKCIQYFILMHLKSWLESICPTSKLNRIHEHFLLTCMWLHYFIFKSLNLKFIPVYLWGMLLILSFSNCFLVIPKWFIKWSIISSMIWSATCVIYEFLWVYGSISQQVCLSPYIQVVVWQF